MWYREQYDRDRLVGGSRLIISGLRVQYSLLISVPSDFDRLIFRDTALYRHTTLLGEAALLGDVALLFQGYECNSLLIVAPNHFDRLIARYRLVSADRLIEGPLLCLNDRR